MKRSRKIAYVLEAIVVFVLMAVLTSFAVPKIGDMIDHEKNESRAEELMTIEVAVARMLADSTVKTLQPTGPIQNVSVVRTNDLPPLMLVDYLDVDGINSSGLGCFYAFSKDGKVTQECP